MQLTVGGFGTARLGETLADGLDDGVPLDVIGIVGLVLDGNTGECSLEGLLGRSVDHLGLSRGQFMVAASWIVIGHVPEYRHHQGTRR